LFQCPHMAPREIERRGSDGCSLEGSGPHHSQFRGHRNPPMREVSLVCALARCGCLPGAVSPPHSLFAVLRRAPPRSRGRSRRPT
jgi:hypothetical protein